MLEEHNKGEGIQVNQKKTWIRCSTLLLSPLICYLIFSLYINFAVKAPALRNIQAFENTWTIHSKSPYVIKVSVRALSPLDRTAGIAVQNGEVNAVQYYDCHPDCQPDDYLPYPVRETGMTIEGLFAYARDCVSRMPWVRCELEVDNELGFPTLVGSQVVYCFSECSYAIYIEEMLLGISLIPDDYVDLPGLPSEPLVYGSINCSRIEGLGEFGLVSLSDIEITSDGNIWVSGSGDGAFYYDPSIDHWTAYGTADGLISMSVTSVTIGEDGVIWFGTQEGISYFNGSRWGNLTESDGLLDNVVRDIAVASDGTIWIAAFRGLSHYDPRTRKWIHFEDSDGLPLLNSQNITISPDESIWISTHAGLSHMVFPNLDIANPTWEHYSLFFPYLADQEYPLDVDVVIPLSDGTYWFGGFEGLARYDSSTKESIFYNGNTTDYQFGATVTAIEIAQDGSLWLGTRGDGIVHYIPAADSSERDSWKYYNSDGGLPTNHIDMLKIAPNGELWVGGFGLARCVITE